MRKRSNQPKLERDRKRPETGNWYIYWTEAGRSREYSTGVADIEEAEILLEEWRQRRLNPGRALEPRECDVNEAISLYLVNRLATVADPSRLEDAAMPIIRFFDGYSVGDINENLTREYCKNRRRERGDKGLTDGTLRRELGLLSTAINFANDQHLITRKVAVRLPQKPEGRIRFLTCEEALRLIRASRSFDTPKIDGIPKETKTEHLTLFLRIGLLTGQRKEAILSLKWSDIDLKSSVIDWNPVGRERTKKNRPKSRLPARLRKFLLRRRRRFPNDEFVITHRGKPVRNIKRAFMTAVKVAMLETEGDQKVVPHVLRHTCATWLMQKGVPMWEASGFLGMTQDTLERNYGHHHPSHQKGAADAI